MPYKYRVTKQCSECGQVLESVSDNFCDGCGIIIPDQENIYNEIHIYRQTKDFDDRVDNLVFHSFECFLKNIGKVGLEDNIRNVSFQYMGVTLFKKLIKRLEETKKK